MKTSLLRFGALVLASASLAIPLAMAQNQSPPPQLVQPQPAPPQPAAPQPIRRTGRGIISGLPLSSLVSLQSRTLRGEAQFLERIALPTGATLHVSLVGRVAGAEYLPLATTIVPARNGITPFQIAIPATQIPAGPYRLQAWIIADNRAMFIGRDAQTIIQNLNAQARITLKMAPKIQNIDGIGNGTPLATTKMTLQGTVSKLDRRALLPDSRIELELRDVSLADAPSKLVLGQVIQLEGGQLPRSFKLELEPADLLPRRRYALSARVLEANKLTYITNTLIEVTPENAGQPFELRVVSAAPTP